MSEILLVDFGASRVKTLLIDSDKSTIVDKEECVSPSAKSSLTADNRFEVPVEDYWKSLLDTAGKIILRQPDKNIKEMWICSEMHGFILSHLDGRAITPYISWKDQRANFDFLDGKSTLDQLKEENNFFRSITGMNLKSGLPFLTLTSGVRTGSIRELKDLQVGSEVRVLSLVDWLLFRGGESKPMANITLAAGLGIYDLKSKIPSQSLLNTINSKDLDISSLEIENDISKPLGKIKIYNFEITVFGGVGDFNAAIQGSGFPHRYDGVLNLGTGSQVAVKENDMLTTNEAEVRIMFDGSCLNVISHIPCGRALNVYASFLDGFSLIGGGDSVFWKIWSSLSPERISKSTLVSKLALFESAWSRCPDDSNGSIGLDEGLSSASMVLEGIAKSWLSQYAKALNKIDPFVRAKTIVVCGGVAQKSKFVIPVLKSLMPERNFVLASTLTGEETLDGLMQLAISSKKTRH